MSERTCYQRNREVILNRAKKYYHDNEEILREKVANKFRGSSEEETNKERKYGRDSYHKMSEEDKQKLKEHQKKYRESKNQTNFFFIHKKYKLVFNIRHNNYAVGKHYSKINKKPININEIDNKNVLSNKASMAKKVLINTILDV